MMTEETFLRTADFQLQDPENTSRQPITWTDVEKMAIRKMLHEWIGTIGSEPDEIIKMVTKVQLMLHSIVMRQKEAQNSQDYAKILCHEAQLLIAVTLFEAIGIADPVSDFQDYFSRRSGV